ncbi:22.0 kDa heat shock protein-like [Andrographis paniculata]|uniref:22.0 kDa heat shock protein-like n=1 Tax=Andrographis paniculata TaxID=175694 RepID=UPI0021E987A9|nr:22.0 kDa heat shock protein-like [Andrographis paniculata]
MADKSTRRLSTAAAAVFSALLFLLFPTMTTALVPYTRSLWDAMFPSDVDPFKILEHSPLSIPRAAAPDDTTGLALARADWRETAGEHQISLDVPGMTKDDVTIQVEENRVLSVTGERKKEAEEKDDRWHRVERTVGKFWRQFRLPQNADMEKVKARMEAGVLRITIPKLSQGEKKKEPKVITIAADDKAASAGENVATISGAGRQEL